VIDWVVASIMAIKLKDIPALFGRWGAESKSAVLPSRQDTPPTCSRSPVEDSVRIAI